MATPKTPIPLQSSTLPSIHASDSGSCGARVWIRGWSPKLDPTRGREVEEEGREGGGPSRHGWPPPPRHRTTVVPSAAGGGTNDNPGYGFLRANRSKSYLKRTLGWHKYPHGIWGDSRNPSCGAFTDHQC
ncbi:uncharacterized protein [Zea mays]|uniref:uncharacterized protein n=1 Tax=Zea mays TaxID=4577 RepID=UPI0004DE9962|nr:uncharacterized protein LOC103650189 [Zea mays]|eukprot:XP_023157886.1 uncharacterized protein LOC103650189 [Zea mays]